MKSQTIKIFHFTILLLISVFCKAQINYNIHLSYGVSNLKESDKESSIQIGNYYTKLPSYSLGFELHIPINESKFQVLSGIDFLSLAAKNNMPADFNDPGYTGPKSWEERFYSFSVPIKLNYKFEKWIHLYSGFSNTFHLNNPENMADKKINHYTIGFTGGINFLIMKRIILGGCYYRDLIPTAKLLQLPSETNTYKISYPFEQLTLTLGVLISKG